MVDTVQEQVNGIGGQLNWIILWQMVFISRWIQNNQMGRRQLIHHNGMGDVRGSDPAKLKFGMVFVIILSDDGLNQISKL